MQLRESRYKKGLLIGAMVGALFAVSSEIRKGGVSVDVFGVGVAIGGALVGGAIGVVIGAFVPTKASNGIRLQPIEEHSAVATSASGNYLARHWCGALSLPVSYWLNGFVGAVLLAVFPAAVSLIDITIHPKVAALGAIVVWIVLLGAQT